MIRIAKFIAIHPVDPPVPFPSEGFEAVARKCKAGVDVDAYWVRSWLQLNDKGEVIKVYCEWDGKDAKSVRKSLDASIPELPPSEGIFRMVEILGEDYR